MAPKHYSGFPLNSGIRFSKCLAPQTNCKLNPESTTQDRTGELWVSLDKKGIPLEATFSSPDSKTCRDDICDLQVLFNGKDLIDLIRQDSMLSMDYPMLVVPKPTGSISPDLGGADSVPPSPGSQVPSQTQASKEISFPSSLPTYVPIIFFGLAGAALIYIIYKSAGTLFGYGGSVQYRNLPPKRTPRSPVTPSRSSAVAPPQARSSSSDEMRQQLLPVIEKLNSISSRLSQVETDVFALTQQIQSPTLKVSTPSASSAINNFDIPSNQYIPPPPPSAPLSIELIREAVLTNNYSLIASYPHHFVSETPESRQGLEDVKRFAIEGDQSQASGRTQSEFIVVPFSTELYLIPNILPNAADPARTIKRHADKNNIYRNGQGANLLNLISLAVVRRNGDRYDLASTGQIA